MSINTTLSKIIILLFLYILAMFLLPSGLFQLLIVYSIWIIGYDLLYGVMGWLSFGHALYFGIGGYVTALFIKFINPNPYLALIAGVAAGLLAGVIFAPIFLRQRGAYFALINLAFNAVFYYLFLIPLRSISGGFDGYMIFYSTTFLNPSNPISISIFGIIIFTLTVMIYIISTESFFGTLIRALNSNEIRLRFLGYNVFRYKTLVFMMSTGISALAGAYLVLAQQYINIYFLDPSLSAEILLADLIGGPGNLYGALLGATIFSVVKLYLGWLPVPWEVTLGLTMLMVILLLKGRGIYNALNDYYQSLRRHKNYA